MENELLLKLLLALFLLVALLFPLISNAVPYLNKTTIDAQCYSSIAAMYNYPNPLTQGEGIRCKTDKMIFTGDEPSLKKQLAHEMVRCFNQFGNFRLHPFFTSQQDFICLTCSTITFHSDVKELNDFDLFLLNNNDKDKSYYETITGKPATGFETAAFSKTPDRIGTANPYTVVWIYANVPTLDDFLRSANIQKTHDVVQRDMLFLIPGSTVIAPFLPSTALGFGSGIFVGVSDQYHDQALFLMPQTQATALGCKILDGTPYLPIA